MRTNANGTMKQASAQLRRLYWIDAALQSGEFPSAVALARDLGVSRGTIHRDLQVLRSTYRAPLTFDPTRSGYAYGHAFRPGLPDLPAEEAITKLLWSLWFFVLGVEMRCLTWASARRLAGVFGSVSFCGPAAWSVVCQTSGLPAARAI